MVPFSELFHDITLSRIKNQFIPGGFSTMRLPSMNANGPRKPAALPSFLAWSIFGQSACLDHQSSWMRSSAKRIPSSLHTSEAFVRLQMLSLTMRLANRMIICRCLFSLALPTLWTTSIASFIFSLNLWSRRTCRCILGACTV